MTLTQDYKAEVEREGYVIVQVLEGDELSEAQAVAQQYYDQIHNAPDADAGSRHANWFLKEGSLWESMYGLAYDPRIVKVIEHILGGSLIWQGGVMFASGAKYTQGWHRDVTQVPEVDIDLDWFSPEVLFNNVQLNLAFFDDECLWIVPRSHNRPNTDAEIDVFQGSLHDSPLGVDMPGAIPVVLKAGQCAFYNNLLIHRGHNAKGAKRVTYHSAYVRKDLPPTWHFYTPRLAEAMEPYFRTLAAPLQQYYDDYQAMLKQYPSARDSYRISDAVRR